MTTAPTATGLTVLDMAQAGRFAEIRELFAPPLRAMVPPEALQAAWAAEIGRRGPVTSIGAPVSDQAAPGVTVVRIPVTFERGELTVVVSVTGDGWLAGIQLAPASAAEPAGPWEPPPYADPGKFEEQDVTLGSGPLAVPGTLSLPRQGGPLPAVVLLSGSGPNDRDETVGQNKPFKDLAWGLASRGVAMLRFEKVTYAHGKEVVQDRGFTVSDEYLPQAIAAIHLLQEHPDVDAGRVFLAGHSLGGTIAPRVAAAQCIGCVPPAMMTSPAIDGSAAASEPTIEALTRQAKTVDNPDLSPSTPDSELPFGVPAPYWLDLRGYHPAATAAGLDKPILIIQGGRDYQVTIADDLGAWKAALDGRPGVTIRVYDADNHLFVPGSGPSGPAEYETPQHMDPAVVADIADWLATVIPAPTAP